MAKIIKLTPDYIAEIKKDFEEMLNSAKLSDGKINFTKTFGNINREATVYFTELAWLKMQTLIKEFDKEVAWHGIAKRGDDPEKDEYYITDILVYPQEVASATVNTDQEKYQMWLMSHDDEVFNNIRMQGHSHVNMTTSPSGVDTSLYDRILEQLDDSMFYIFMIWNKRNEKTIKIYDLAKNVLFETKDCTVKILDDGTGINKFLKDAKEMVKDKVYSRTTSTFGKGYTGGTNGIIGFNGQTGGGCSSTNNNKKDTNYQKSDKSPVVTFDKKNGKRKGRRKGSASDSEKEIQIDMFHSNADNIDNWGDPYDPLGYYDGWR